MSNRAGATQVRKQGLGRGRELRAGDFVHSGFVAGARYHLFDDDELRLGSSGDSQVLQDGDTVFVGPVVQDLADEENRDIFLPRWLRVKETEALKDRKNQRSSF